MGAEENVADQLVGKLEGMLVLYMRKCSCCLHT
jgi:hypothetical protein